MLYLNSSTFPTLTTDRLVLRRPLATDDREILSLRSDANVNKYLDRPIASSIRDAQQFLQKLNSTIDNNEGIAWAINLKGDTTLLGVVCFWNISKETAIAEIGFELTPRYQGRGIMLEAVLKAVNYAFTTMNVTAIEGWTHKENISSKRLMEKCNFCRDTEAEANHEGQDYFGNMVIYSLKQQKNVNL